MHRDHETKSVNVARSSNGAEKLSISMLKSSSLVKILSYLIFLGGVSKLERCFLFFEGGGGKCSISFNTPPRGATISPIIEYL